MLSFGLDSVQLGIECLFGSFGLGRVIFGLGEKFLVKLILFLIASLGGLQTLIVTELFLALVLVFLLTVLFTLAQALVVIVGVLVQ